MKLFPLLMAFFYKGFYENFDIFYYFVFNYCVIDFNKTDHFLLEFFILVNLISYK